MTVLRLALLLAIAMGFPAQGAALFPTPLHLVRRIEEPAAHKVSVVEEYCEGNRVITVSQAGRLVTIADYGAQELTEIFRDRHEFSVTPFAAIARARAGTVAPAGDRAMKAGPSSWQTRFVGSKPSASGRTADVYELSRSGESIEVAFDRTVPLSRAAAEVLIGGSYPSAHGQQHDAMLEAGRGTGGAHAIASLAATPSEVFALPIDQTITHSVDGASMTVRISIVQIDAAVIPRERLAIAPGSRQIESRLTRLERELAATEQLPQRSKP